MNEGTNKPKPNEREKRARERESANGGEGTLNSSDRGQVTAAVTRTTPVPHVLSSFLLHPPRAPFYCVTFLENIFKQSV